MCNVSMDDLGERSGRSYRPDTGVDDTAHDVARQVNMAEEDMAANGVPQSRQEFSNTFLAKEAELKAKMVAQEAEDRARGRAWKEEKQEREALAASIARASAKREEMMREQAQRQVQRPHLEPVRRENPIVAFINGLKGMFTRRKAA